MKIDKEMESRLISISESIKHVAISDTGHIPDKIACLITNMSLIKLEINRLVDMRDDVKVKLEDLLVGDTFKEYPNSKYSPLYTIVKKDSNGMLVESSVTCPSICKLKEVWVKK